MPAPNVYSSWCLPPVFVLNTPNGSNSFMFSNSPSAANFPQPYANLSQSMMQQSQQHYSHYQNGGYSSRLPFGKTMTAASTPSPPLNFHSAVVGSNLSSQNPVAGMKYGVGILIWLNTQTGLINFGCKNEDDNGLTKTSENCLVSFEIKDFGDQAVNDLTSVLRVGFALKFQAVLSLTNDINKPRYNATFVAPASTDDLKAASACNTSLAFDLQRLLQQLDTPIIEPLPCPDPNRRQNQYDVDRETKCVQFMMDLFRRTSQPHCALHTIHCIVSNCGDEQIYNYVGNSSLKRRQFIERRGHLFSIGSDESVCLVPGALYVAITTLVKEMLKRGGAMLLQELFDLYLTWPDVPLESRELVGDTKQQFLKFLDGYPWIFSVFPSRVFVAARRRLPDFDYPSYLIDCFGDQEGSPFWDYAPSNLGTVTSPPPPLTPAVCHTPKYPVPSTPFSFSSNHSGTNEGNMNSTKFSFNHHDSNANFSSGWSTFDDTPPPPTPNNAQTPSYIVTTHPPPNVINVGASTTNSSVGSSSLSLASFSSEPVPPTPPSFAGSSGVFPCFNLFGNYTNIAGDLNGTTSNVDGGAVNTPGFWKSYDLGTEDLVKNLVNFEFRRSPTSMFSNESHVKSCSTAKTFAVSDIQTEDICLNCLKCGSQLAFGADGLKIGKNIEKPSFKEISCQTDDAVCYDKPSYSPVETVPVLDDETDDIANLVAKFALED